MIAAAPRHRPDPPLASADALAPVGDRWAPTAYWPGRRHTVGGTVLHVRETPGPHEGAETAVFVHGLGGSANNWTELARGLSSRCRGLAVDLPGFGRTPPPASGDYRPAAHADVLEGFLDAVGGPVHLLGNSLGGAVSLLLAARRPDLVRTLTLVSPAVPDRRLRLSRLGGGRAALALLPLVGARAYAELAARSPAERVAATMALCHADPTRVGPGAVAMAEQEAAERAACAHAPEALHRSFLGLMGTWFSPPARSLWSAAGAVRAPSLVVWGELDRLVGVGRAARTASALPAGRLLRLPDTGHVAQIERPVLVGRAVVGLMDAAADGRWPAAPEPAPSPVGARSVASPGVWRSRSSACDTVPV